MTGRRAFCFGLGYVLVGLAAALASADNVCVDVNLDMKHSVRGVSDFGRSKHITVHANVFESDWKGEDVAKHYLMNELDVYFGRDNGNASWFFRFTPQDPDKPGAPDVSEVESLGDWWREQYLAEGSSVSSYEDRARELIMGTNPDAVLPSNNYRKLSGRDDKGGKYMLRDSAASAEWIAEYLATCFRGVDNPNAQLRPKYWEVTNEPDMILNTRDHFFLSSWEQIFEYHNLVADKVRRRLGDRAPLIGGMAWGLHDLGDPDYWHRANGEEERKKIISQYYRDPSKPEANEGDRIAWQRVYESTESDVWNKDVKQPFAQWDYIWKGFIDAAGENMDFYSIHFYDWVSNGEGPDATTKGKFRYGGPVEAVFEMLEWYQQYRFGESKPWVISEYGSIVGPQSLDTDFRWGDWTHVQTFNRMLMQFLQRPDMIVKSMPFAPIKGTWGYSGDLRYEPSLMQTDAPYADIFQPETEWYFTDKLQWYQLWADVDGTRVDTSSTDPDVQADAYVKDEHLFLILNNLEWETSTVDLSLLGADDNELVSVRMKHSYLAEGLSEKTPGHGVLADATLDSMPETVVLPGGSTIVLDIEYDHTITIDQESREVKYYGDSLSGAGREAGAIHRVEQKGDEYVTAHVRGVAVPRHGEAAVRVTGQFHGRHMTYHRPGASGFLINGQEIWPKIETREEGPTPGQLKEHYDFVGLDYEGTHHTYLRSFDLPVPLEYLQEDNEIRLRVLGGGTYVTVNIVVWDMSRAAARSDQRTPDPWVAATGVTSREGQLTVGRGQSIAVDRIVLPVTASDKTLVWSSDDPKVASVDANGIVTGVGKGETRILGVTSDGGYELVKSLTVTDVLPESVEILYGDAETIVGGDKQLYAFVRPWQAANKAVTWRSQDCNVATVDENGVVSGVGAGRTAITAKTAVGGFEAQVVVCVTVLPVEDMTISPEFAVIPLGESLQIEPTWSPANASNRSLKWHSSSPAVAEVDRHGHVTACGLGKTTVSAVAADGGISDATEIEVVNADAEPFFVEAESFSRTGGAFEGFKINEQLANINYNQSGDWVEYDIPFPNKGTYQFLLDAGTPLDNAGVEVFINGESVGSAALPNTGQWDLMRRTVVSNGLSVPEAGNYTVRLMSVGAPGAWQWNADKLGFRRLTSTVRGGVAAEL